MGIVTDHTINQLASLPLFDVMSKMGYQPTKKSATDAYYLCPFPDHDDNDPSFHINLRPKVGELATWKCFGCGKGGAGAITLLAALHGKDYKEDFLWVCKELAKMFNLPLVYQNEKTNEQKEEYENGFFHRAKRVDAKKDLYGPIQIKEKDATWQMCEALGCRRRYVADEVDYTVKSIECSWGNDFSPNNLCHDFSVANVEWMLLPYRGEGTKRARLAKLMMNEGDERNKQDDANEPRLWRTPDGG